jgi:dephospho-CoA kinase
MIQIALIGRLRSGKSTVMEMLQKVAKEEYSIELAHKRLADPIYAEAHALYERHGLVWRKNRSLLEGIGAALNDDYPDGDKLLQIYQESYDPEANIICDDTRRIGQADFFRNQGWPIIRVSAPDEVRKSRCKPGEWSEGHITDRELDQYVSDFTINNYDNTLESLYNECKEIFRRIINEYGRKG